MEFVQLNLADEKELVLTEECFIHEFKFKGDVSHLNSELQNSLIFKLIDFNQNNGLIKFILNEQSNKTFIPTSLYIDKSAIVELYVVQLGDEKPMTEKIYSFIQQLGLKDIQGSLRSYSVQTKIPSIVLHNDHGLTHFFNELFWVHQTSHFENEKAIDFRSILIENRQLIQSLIVTFDLFSVDDLRSESSHTYLKLVDLTGQVHCYKASYWIEHMDGPYFYFESRRINLDTFNQDRETHRQQLMKQLEQLDGVQSLDELFPF